MESTETPGVRAYEDRYCAFVDILGFSELVAQIKSGEVSPDSIKDLLREVHEYPSKEYAVLFEGSDFQASSISDAVCISVKPTLSGLANISFVLSRLTLRLLRYGYFVRGAIVKGRLYHDNQTVFGEALIRAYRLESETVRYPRIMIASEVFSDFESIVPASIYARELKEMVADAEDGPRFLNVLSQYIRDLGLPSPEKRMASYRTIREKIQERFDKSRDNPKHFEKVRWFAIYWNSYTMDHGLGVDISGRSGSTLV